MTDREQIEEIGLIIADGFTRWKNSNTIAEDIYKEGYRKQRENVIELPCKVGDTVYYINEYYDICLHKDTIYEAKVARMVITKNNEISLVIHIKDESGLTEYPNVKDFGKTVFLSRAEAEAKTKGDKE